MNPVYLQAAFLKSASKIDNTPPDTGKEIAFAGRSNAGKSSAINALTQKSNLARTSKTPGRTQLLNFFHINEEQRFVDLPGYGYAKVPEDVKNEWHELMEVYFRERQSLCGVILVMDVRRPLTEFDWQMVRWCQYSNLPMHLLLTKADKLAYGAAKSTLLQVQKVARNMTMPVTAQLFSALKKSGIDEVHDALDHLFTDNNISSETSESAG
ncbi:MAG: YihA family ribosome biogenesis GTP-binding protein [Gammaproteobacteria bacterium]|nr:YihA family ribosome biogenesis GTP-binding protein [Gammaproteobacteria bacterium]